MLVERNGLSCRYLGAAATDKADGACDVGSVGLGITVQDVSDMARGNHRDNFIVSIFMNF